MSSAPRTNAGASPSNSPPTSLGGTLLLASIPLGVAIVLGALLLPRSVPPGEVPLPTIDVRALEKTAREDHALADEARRAPLPAEMRAVGSALRAFNVLRTHASEPELVLHKQKADLDEAVSRAFLSGGVHPFLVLRAVQLEAFLDEVRRYEATGQTSEELTALGGSFVPRMTAAGWVRGRQVIMSDAQRRAAFKMMWIGTVAAEGMRELQLTFDETRALYDLYLRYPHPSEPAVLALEAARRGAHDAAACAALKAGERVETERWRIDKLRKLGALDPSYPLSFALGVANYRRGSFGAAAENFRDWIRDHPNGRYTLSARNHLKAAIDADQAGP